MLHSRKLSLPDSDIKRILVVKFRHLGDVLLMTPLLTCLKQAFPGADIDVIGYRETSVVLRDNPAVHRLFTYGGLGTSGAGDLMDDLAMLLTLRRERYDLVINLTEGDRGTLLTRVTGARWRVGPAHPAVRGRRWKRRTYTHLYRTDQRRRHIVEQQLDALRRLGVALPLESEPLCYVVPASARIEVESRLRAEAIDTPFIVLHPTSRWLFKCLLPAQVSFLIGAIREAGYAVILTSGPDQRESDVIAAILDETTAVEGGVFDWAGKLSIPELAALIDKAHAFVGADSLPMHLAAALRTPVLAWFGPSIDVVWRPWMVPHRILKLDVSCRPCGLDGCGGGKRSECLTGITNDMIRSELARLLALASESTSSSQQCN